MFNDKSVPTLLRRFGRRFACTFLPALVRRQGGTTKPQYWNAYPTSDFDAIGPSSQALLNEIITLAPDPRTAILDLGCNVGRHLNYLHHFGYRNLYGVDFSSSAVSDMQKRYPEMCNDSHILISSFQDFLTRNPVPVDLVYTRGATFELVHPSFPLIERVCAIAKSYVVMVISETEHAYPRFWSYEFARQGFELTHLRRPASTSAPDHAVSLMTFRRLEA